MTASFRRSVAIFAVAAAIATLLATVTTRADAQPAQHTMASHSMAHMAHGHSTTTAKQLAFHDAMRKLWEDHITWTRLAIVDIAAGAPSTNATVARLMKNQEDIGNAVKPFYGKAAGAKLTTLLKQHIAIAAEIIGAAKTANQAGVTSAQQRWLANANEIAALLHSANPKQWSLKMLKAMMVTHLDLTTREAVAWLGGDWSASTAAYDNVHTEILAMSDMLSTGIERQFPARFR
jgi:hypothetical protein